METADPERAPGTPLLSGILSGARRLQAWLNRRLHPRAAAKKEKPVVEGLPPGLTWEVLAETCQIRLGGLLDTVTYQHLSGWKSHGAYRLHVRLAGGRMSSLIYKHALYDHEEIPALKGFPALPGPAEYVIYRLAVKHPDSRLGAFLPKTYLADELEPGRLYNFLFEDISERYERATWERQRMPVAAQIVDLHAALAELLPSPLPDTLIQYDLAYSRSLREYARTNLERYHVFTGGSEPALAAVLDRWDELTALHERGLQLPGRQTGPIHGDLNFANVYVPKDGKGTFKALDWEWAGCGPLIMDMAAFMKGLQLAPMNAALRDYARADGRDSIEVLRPVFYTGLLERSFNDAAYLAAQQMDRTSTARVNVTRIITRALQRTMAICQELTKESDGSDG